MTSRTLILVLLLGVAMRPVSAQSGPDQVVLLMTHTKTNRTLILTESRRVKVDCENKRGKLKYRRAVIAHISEDSITFQPRNETWAAVSYCTQYSTYDLPVLQRISFVTTGSAMKALVINGGLAAWFYGITVNPYIALGTFLLVVIGKPILEIIDLATLYGGRKFPYPGGHRKHVRSHRWTFQLVRR